MNTPREDLHDFVDTLAEEWLAEVPSLHTDSLAVIARIVRMSYYIERKVDPNLARFDLTRGEFEVLAVLTRNPQRQITPKDLYSKILITSGGLSNRIKKLEAAGLLVREPDPSDGRGVILKVTPKGRRVALEAVTSHVEIERQLLENLAPEDRTALARLLKKLLLSQSSGQHKDALNG